MDRVNELLLAGLAMADAIKQVLREKGLKQTEFAQRYMLSPSMTNEVLNLDRTPRSDVMKALAAEFGGRPYEWALLFWENSQPREGRFATAAQPARHVG